MSEDQVPRLAGKGPEKPNPVEWSVDQASLLAKGLEKQVNLIDYWLDYYHLTFQVLRKLAVERELPSKDNVKSSLNIIPRFFLWENQTRISDIPECLGYLERLTTSVDLEKHKAENTAISEYSRGMSRQFPEGETARSAPVQVNIPVNATTGQRGKGVGGVVKSLTETFKGIIPRPQTLEDPRNVLRYNYPVESTIQEYKQLPKVWYAFIEFYHGCLSLADVMEPYYPKTKHPKTWMSLQRKANRWFELINAAFMKGIISAAEAKRDKLEEERLSIFRAMMSSKEQPKGYGAPIGEFNLPTG